MIEVLISRLNKIINIRVESETGAVLMFASNKWNLLNIVNLPFDDNYKISVD